MFLSLLRNGTDACAFSRFDFAGKGIEFEASPYADDDCEKQKEYFENICEDVFGVDKLLPYTFYYVWRFLADCAFTKKQITQIIERMDIKWQMVMIINFI